MKLRPPLVIWRCQKCGRRLADLRLTAGSSIEVKCSSCNTMNRRSA